MSPRQELALAVRKMLLETMERRPVSEHPAEGTRSLVDDGKQRTQAIFRDVSGCVRGEALS